MKKIIILLVFLITQTSLIFSSQKISVTESGFPDKPIKIIVYTGPGGLIDITARKFTDIAAKYTDVNFVVENKDGAGGIVALKRILQMPADGYALYACTKSNIAKFVSTGGTSYIESLEWLAMLMADPECVIVNSQTEINNWQKLVEDGINKKGKQIWVGPAAGGLDHVTALKVWDAFNFSAKWIPYKSGGKAVAALLGNQGVAYVGNPRDILANPALSIAAVSNKERLKQFPDTPTFSELGIDNLNEEYMWRGFAIKQGISNEVRNWYKQLFAAVTADPEWRAFWEKGGIDVVYYDTEKFTEIVQDDAQTFKFYLNKLGILKTENDSILNIFINSKKTFSVFSLITLIVLILVYLFNYRKRKHLTVPLLIITFFIVISLIFYIQTFFFPASNNIGPEVIPRLWIYLLIPLNILLLIKTLKSDYNLIDKSKNLPMILKTVLLLIAYLIMIYFLGYFISSFIFIYVCLQILGYPKKRIALIISSGWIIFSWLVFYKLLYVPLPIGYFIEMLL